MENYGNNMGDLAGVFAAMGIGSGIILIVVLISMWKIFTKAGRPGWEGIIPIYNIYVMITEIIGKPVKWFYYILGGIILSFIPFVGILVSIALLVIMIIILNDLAKAFGKGVGFTVGLVLLGIIFYPILAFGPAQYQGKVYNNENPATNEA
jgi:hypothetical protein